MSRGDEWRAEESTNPDSLYLDLPAESSQFSLTRPTSAYERKALIRNFVEGIKVVGDEATVTYTGPHAQRRCDVGVGFGS